MAAHAKVSPIPFPQSPLGSSKSPTQPITYHAPSGTTGIKYEDTMYDYSDPKRVGRGAWMVFMIQALSSETEDELRFTCKMIRNTCRMFKCGECHGHCTAYIEKNPPEKAIASARTLFSWIVTFMSAVNVRTGRPAYDEERLYKLFSDQNYMVCHDKCGSTVEITVPPESRSEIDELARKNPNLIIVPNVTKPVVATSTDMKKPTRSRRNYRN